LGGGARYGLPASSRIKSARRSRSADWSRNLARDSELLPAGANVVLSVVLCLVVAWLGAAAAAALNKLKEA
jgi:hypothetical protein